MLASTRSLLTGIIDYAGTFPPAGLSLAESIAEYQRVRSSGESWLLGRFIVPSTHLPEFDELSAQREGGGISVVFGPQAAAQLAQTLQYIERRPGGHRIASVELPPLNPSEIAQLSHAVPETMGAFFEVPIDADLESRIKAIAASGALAKVRTGGTASGAFPSPEGLVRFFEACSEAGVAFKATAGLHHAIRGCYALTYEPGSKLETMYGFLNVSIAAAIIHVGGESAEAVAALRETSADEFHFPPDGVVWKTRTIAVDDLAASRRLFFRSLGSCSVREPVEELAKLRLL